MAHKQNEFNVQNIDYDATIKHYQDLNSRIEQKTHEVFESVTKLNNLTEKDESKSVENVLEISSKRNSSGHQSLQPGDTNKNQLIVDMNKKLLSMQNELQLLVLRNKQLEQDKEKQKQDLNYSKDGLKKMKAALSSRQTAQDLYKKEMDQIHDKLKLEEQSQKDLQKEVERLSKQLVSSTREKARMEEKLESFKSDMSLLKQHKESDCSRNQALLMMKCIKRQAVLIENLLNQVSLLERENTPSEQS